MPSQESLSYKHKYSLKLCLLALTFCIFFIKLGNWQYNKSIFKKEMVQLYKKSLTLDPILIEDINLYDHNSYQKIQSNVTFLPNKIYLIDNQIHNKKAGYRVIIPGKIFSYNKIFLFDFGWIDKSLASQENIHIAIRNIIDNPVIFFRNRVATGIVLKEDIISSDKIINILQEVNYNLIRKDLKTEVCKQTFTITPSIFQDIPVSFGVSSDKHLSYALQWYTFSILVIIYTIINAFRSMYVKEQKL